MATALLHEVPVAVCRVEQIYGPSGWLSMTPARERSETVGFLQESAEVCGRDPECNRGYPKSRASQHALLLERSPFVLLGQGFLRWSRRPAAATKAVDVMNGTSFCLALTRKSSLKTHTTYVMKD